MLNPNPLSFLSNAIVTDLDPLIVTSPTPRSGTTLLQRLLCSSRSTLIYGEKCAQDLEFFLNIYAFKAQEYNYQRERTRRNLQRVLQGEVNDWLQDLMPETDGYLAAMRKAAFAGITYCRDFARSAGRPIWGFKYPGWGAGTIQLLRAVMPQARFLFIIRDLGACLKSAKAQQLVITLSDAQEFCQKWADNVAFCNSLQGSRSMLIVNYAALVEKPWEVVQEIAEFSGIQDMEVEVIQKKINTLTGQHFEAQVKDGYIPPAELGEAELQIVGNVTAALKQALTA
jgi:hypothetical protein